MAVDIHLKEMKILNLKIYYVINNVKNLIPIHSNNNKYIYI